MSKTVEIRFSELDRYAIFMHFQKNVLCNTGREQDEFDDIWSTLKLDDIDNKIKALARPTLDEDFGGDSISCEFTKEEVGYFIKFCERPMLGALSRYIRPLRIRAGEARDKAGLKAVPAE